MMRQKLIPTHMSSVKRTCFNSLSSADAILINKSLFQLPEISVIPEIISISTVYISRFLLLTFFLDVLDPLFSFFLFCSEGFGERCWQQFKSGAFWRAHLKLVGFGDVTRTSRLLLTNFYDVMADLASRLRHFNEYFKT